jgi:ornithine cyclodeaminase/alanine dehydrogenase-like protein (mu-crystallin family)
VSAVPPALLLDRATLARLMTPADHLAAAREAFLALAQGRAQAPLPLHLVVAGGGFHAKGAALQGPDEVVAVKLNANFPANPTTRGLPTIQGVILLCDAADGRLLAVLDSAEITVRRTAAASALAASLLARPDSATMTVCGCGAQAAAQIEALRAVLSLRSIRAWDADPAKAAALGSACGVEPVASLAEATRDADVVVTCTTARTPFLIPELVKPGAFVAAVGADSPDKNELAPALLALARVVPDSLEQCLAMGDLRHAVAAGAMRADAVHATLADVVAGTAARPSADAVTVFDSTGIAVQDVTAALAAYRLAQGAGAGRTFAFA